MPGFDGFHDLGRYAKRGVDFAVFWLRSRGFANFQHAAAGRGQDNGRDLMRAELLANAPP